MGEYLRQKWELFCQGLDTNQKGRINIEDSNVFVDRFIFHHKLEEPKASEIRAKFRAFYKAAVLFGLDEITPKLYMEMSAQQYSDDKETFTKMRRTWTRDLVDIYDINDDGLLSTEEYTVATRCWGLEKFDRKLIDAFPQVKPGFISKEDYVNAFEEFLTNDDRAKSSLEYPLLLTLGLA